MMAIASCMPILGNMLGPVIGGFVAGHFGITASFVVNSCMPVTAGVIVWKDLDESPCRTPAGAVEKGHHYVSA